MIPKRDILIIGATPQGLQAALTLAHHNKKVLLIDSNMEIDGPPKHWSEKAKRWHRYLLKQISYHPLIEILKETELAEMSEGSDGVEVELIQRPQWVLPSSCVDCGKCALVCPVELWDGRKPIFEVTTPTTMVIDKRNMAPCRSACPIGMNVQGYVALVAQGRFEEAYELILDTNPLPGVCGRVCHHPCEKECRRQEIDEAVAICAVKRFATDEASKKGKNLGHGGFTPPHGPRVAIIGSGPAGLTAAHDLAKAGFRPTLIEAESEPGGLLRQGIAPYRLPRGILDQEIERILAMGVDLRLNTAVSSWGDIERLKAEGFNATLLATGASKDLFMSIRGEDLHGVYGCVAFLKGLWNGRRPESLGRVAVIGGGNAAVEAARASVRCGARSVTLLYRRSRKEMPADPHEVEQALEEGVKLRCLTLPVEFEGRRDRLARIRCIRMKLEGHDASGRPKPIPIHGSDFFIQADTAIVSIGQGVDLPYAIDGPLELTRWGTIKTTKGVQGNIPGIYASGDVVSGPSTVVEAMASGRRAAQMIIGSLGAAEEVPSWEPEPYQGEYEPIPKEIPRQKRRPIPHRSVPERVRDYEEVMGPLSAKEAIEEASRCLQCGVCSECLRCEDACELDVIRHDRISIRQSLRFDRIVVADDAQMVPGVDSSRLVRVPFGKTKSATKAMLGGRVVAFDTISEAPLEKAQPILRKSLGEGDLQAGVFICSCNDTLNESGQLDEMVAALEGVPGVAHREVLISACHPEKGPKIEEVIHERGLNGALIASCVCCHLDFVCESCTDQRIRLKHRLFGEAGYEPKDIALVNIKETCLLPFKDDPKTGIDLATRVIRSGLWQLREYKEWAMRSKEPYPQALILGATEAGVSAAKCFKGKFPSVVVVDDREVDEDVQQELQECGIDIIWPIKPARLDGQRGEFTLIVENKEASVPRSIPAGVVILGRDEFKKVPYRRDPFVRNVHISTKKALGTLETSIPGVYMASWAQTLKVPQVAFGKAAASEALDAIVGRTNPPNDLVAHVDPELCRGCGRCADICPEGAARLEEIDRGVASSWIDPGVCVGCGDCMAECPTGAIQMPESDQEYFEKVIDVFLE